MCVISVCVFLLPPHRRWGRQLSGRLWSQHRTDSPPPADTQRHNISSFIQDMRHNIHTSVFHLGNMILIQASITSNCYVTMSSAVSKHTDTLELHNVSDWRVQSSPQTGPTSQAVKSFLWLRCVHGHQKITWLSFYLSERLNKTLTTVSCIWVTRWAKETDHVRQ